MPVTLLPMACTGRAGSGFFRLLNRGLPAGELVDDDVVLQQDEAVEAPARGVRLALEAEHIEHHIAHALPVHLALVDLEAAAAHLGHHALAHAVVEVADRDDWLSMNLRITSA